MIQTHTTLSMQQMAARQLADYDAHHPGTIFAEGLELSVAEGYALQAAVADLRQQRGERIIGYKVGCISPKIQSQLGIDQCVTARLYETERHASGVVLSRSGYADLAIEGELAVELSSEPIEEDFGESGIPACVACVFPVMELHNHVLRGERPSAGELIANNAIHAGFVEGRGGSLSGFTGGPELTIRADGRILDSCSGPVLIETIASSLQWLMQVVRERGERLHAGQIVLTGSIPSLIPVTRDARIQVDSPPFGSVEASFTA